MWFQLVAPRIRSKYGWRLPGTRPFYVNEEGRAQMLHRRLFPLPVLAIVMLGGCDAGPSKISYASPKVSKHIIEIPLVDLSMDERSIGAIDIKAGNVQSGENVVFEVHAAGIEQDPGPVIAEGEVGRGKDRLIVCSGLALPHNDESDDTKWHYRIEMQAPRELGEVNLSLRIALSGRVLARGKMVVVKAKR